MYHQGPVFGLIADDVLHLKVDVQSKPLFGALAPAQNLDHLVLVESILSHGSGTLPSRITFSRDQWYDKTWGSPGGVTLRGELLDGGG